MHVAVTDSAPSLYRKKQRKKGKAPETDSLREYLSAIFPYKREYFRQQFGRLSLNLIERQPWTPPPLELLDQLIPELKEKKGAASPDSLWPVLEDLSRQFGDIEIELILPGRGARREETGITVRRKSIFRKGETIQLEPFEFALFCQAFVTGSYEMSEIVTILSRPDRAARGTAERSLSRKTHLLPAGTILSEVFETPGDDGALDRRIINPVSGEEFALSDSVDYRTRVVTAGSDPFRFTGSGAVFGSRKRKHCISELPVKTAPCSNCLACAVVCPSRLYPSLIYHHLKAEHRSEALELNISACISCGDCSAICPSSIPLAAEIIPARIEIERMYADEE